MHWHLEKTLWLHLLESVLKDASINRVADDLQIVPQSANKCLQFVIKSLIK